VITKAQQNVIEQLGGRPAMEVLRDVVQKLDERDRQLLAHGLLIGRAISEYREKFNRGDFLIRGITGADESSGSIAVADLVRAGRGVLRGGRDRTGGREEFHSRPHRELRALS